MLTGNNIWILSWYIVMKATYIVRSKLRKVRTSAKIRYSSGWCRWVLLCSICMKGRSCTEIWRLRTSFWRMVKFGLVILVLLRCWIAPKILLIHALVLLIICLQNFSKINHTATNQMFGHLAVSSTKCATSGMPLMHNQSTGWQSKSCVVAFHRWIKSTAKISEIWSERCCK